MAQVKYVVVCLVIGLFRVGFSQTVAPVKVVPARIQPISETIEGHGIVDPNPQGDVKISAISPMRLDAILAKPGEPVQKGQLLVRLQRDPSIDVGVEKAKINMRQAELNLERYQKLYENGVIPKVKLEQTQTEYSLSKADFDLQSRALKYAIENSQIRSPIQGLVSSVNGVVGEITDPSQAILRIVNIKEMVARIGVEIEDIDKIREGQPAEITIPNLPGDQIFRGKVVRLNKEIDPVTQLVHVWIYVDNPEGLLQPGMFAEGHIFVKIEPHALIVPKSSVLKDKTGPYVFVISEKTAHRVDVKMGIQTNATVQILAGLREGQDVVFEGNYELEDGVLVNIQKGR